MSDELRGQVIDTLRATEAKEWHEQADAVLALPEIREALADLDERHREIAVLLTERDEARAALAEQHAAAVRLAQAVNVEMGDLRSKWNAAEAALAAAQAREAALRKRLDGITTVAEVLIYEGSVIGAASLRGQVASSRALLAAPAPEVCQCGHGITTHTPDCALCEACMRYEPPSAPEVQR